MGHHRTLSSTSCYMLHDVSWFLYISDSMWFLGSCSMRRVSQSSEFDEAICLWVSFPQTRGQALKECGGFRCSLSKQPMAHGMCGSHKAQWSTQSRSLQASKDPLLAAKVRRWCHLESSGKQYSWSNTPDLRCLGLLMIISPIWLCPLILFWPVSTFLPQMPVSFSHTRPRTLFVLWLMWVSPSAQGTITRYM